MLAAITFTEILQLIALIIVVHAVLLGPLVYAIAAAWVERGENEAIRNQQRL